MTETLEDAYRRLNSELATVIEERDTLRERLATLQKEYDSLVIAREAELGVCQVHCELLATEKAKIERLRNKLRRIGLKLANTHEDYVNACTERNESAEVWRDEYHKTFEKLRKTEVQLNTISAECNTMTTFIEAADAVGHAIAEHEGKPYERGTCWGEPTLDLRDAVLAIQSQLAEEKEAWADGGRYKEAINKLVSAVNAEKARADENELIVADADTENERLHSELAAERAAREKAEAALAKVDEVLFCYTSNHLKCNICGILRDLRKGAIEANSQKVTTLEGE